MARQLTGTRVLLTLEAKSLQYKPRALTLKNCILPSFLYYRANKGVLRKKQARCWFRQRSENFSLPTFLGTKSRLLTCRVRQPRFKIVTSLLVVVVKLKWTDYRFIIWGSERSRPTNLLILCVCVCVCVCVKSCSQNVILLDYVTSWITTQSYGFQHRPLVYVLC